jgi:glycosyltransferase involved in cell wall biosynthesis
MRNVNFTMFEASRIPSKWVKWNRRTDLVILPTESSKRAWVDSGFPEPQIRLCPLGVDPDLFHPDVEPLPLGEYNGRPISDYRVRVLNVSDVSPRKNLPGLLRVWMRTTKPTDDAVLILKINCPFKLLLREFRRRIERLETQIGTSRQEAAPIVFIINQAFSDAQLPRLYAAATHYWSMSRGEGWDLPMTEAAATGLHLIAPQHTAYTTYLDESVATMIPARRVPANVKWSSWMSILFRGADWWEPDEEVAAHCIRQTMTNPGEGKNLAARQRIAETFTWKKATTRLIEILNELGCT